ncbi:AraC family transcriptional regulator [Hymenobacter sp. PAMC 26628]|uniref:AraC family transcriptional regulator n=1 Tax=Hymenobacter sp. PAMC 26628 TaxID=1484118 RepID=UPI0007704CE2|nr:helix-turn-helix domain-containing protein [Hymenobacter sp. PAMC 26628]AMJ66000.1 hypothetical protein AXW84_11580 [Hymenobacter sp. PAMC 26628]
MIYQFIQPAPALRPYIRQYQLFHFTFDRHAPIPVKSYPACPEEGFSFFLRGRLQTECPELGTTETCARAAIFGLPDYRQNFRVPDDFMLLHAWFQPGALFKFLRIPMPELLHQAIDAEAVWGSEIRSLTEQLANTASYAELPRILDQFFWQKARQLVREDHPLDHIGQRLLAQPGSFELSQLAATACLSPRAFERRFEQQVGVTPKYFARICRFWMAIKHKESDSAIDWLSLALHHGYSDYQHLAKDFRQFAGVTPSLLLQQVAQDPEHLLRLTPEQR